MKNILIGHSENLVFHTFLNFNAKCVRSSFLAGIIACRSLHDFTRKRLRRIFHTTVYGMLSSLDFEELCLKASLTCSTFSSDTSDRPERLPSHDRPLRMSCTSSLCCDKQVDPMLVAKCSLHTHNRLRTSKFQNTESLLRLCQRHFEGFSASGGCQPK